MSSKNALFLTANTIVNLAPGGVARLQAHSGGVEIQSALSVSTINEYVYSPGSGVTVDGVLIKDGLVDGVDVSALSTTVAGKANTSHTHPASELTATGGTSTSFLRKDNTWATPTNTTYTEISEAEITAGTASTLRTMTGRRAGFLKNADNHISGTTNKVYTATEQTKLAGIATGAQVNDVTLTNTATLTNKTLTSPVINSPTGIVKGDVGLGNVDNTSDATKNAATATLTNKTISGANNTITNISPSSLALTKSTDANGWTVYDYGTFKKYIKSFGPYTTSSMVSLGTSTLTTTANMPVGVAPNSVHQPIVSWIVSNLGNSSQASCGVVLYDHTSTSTSFTYNLSVRNITSVSLAYADLFVTIELTTK